MPLVLYEVANDGIHVFPKNCTMLQGTVDRLSDATQTFRPFLVLAGEITNFRSSSGIANSQLSKDHIFLWMVVNPRVKFEITNNRVNNLIVGAIPAVENLKLSFDDR